MGNLVDGLMFIIILCAWERPLTFAQPCNLMNNTVSGNNHQGPNKNCDEQMISPAGGATEQNEDVYNDIDGDASHAMYTSMMVIGVILIPVIVLARICWLRKLNRQRNNAINEVRRIVDQRLQEEQRRRNGVFSIDLANVPFEDIYGKPPSYEECLANISTGCPPPYDQLSSDNQKESSINSQYREQDGENSPLPSTSSNG